MCLCVQGDSEGELNRIGLTLRKSFPEEQLQKIEVRFTRKSIDFESSGLNWQKENHG